MDGNLVELEKSQSSWQVSRKRIFDKFEEELYYEFCGKLRTNLKKEFLQKSKRNFGRNSNNRNR